MRHIKCSLCLLVLPKESLGYTVLTGLKARVSLALSSKKKDTVRFAKNQALFSLHFTPYSAPKDVKSFHTIEEFFLLGLNKFGFHEFQYKGAKLSKKLSA